MDTGPEGAGMNIAITAMAALSIVYALMSFFAPKHMQAGFQFLSIWAFLAVIASKVME